MKIPDLRIAATSTAMAHALARASFENQEDLDLMIVEQAPEACPTCDSIQELQELIKNWKGGRNITMAFAHCTASHQTATVQSILNYWENVRKWKNPGYHIIVTPDKGWTMLQPFELQSNGVLNYNANSVHISYIGGIDKKGKPVDNRTESQKQIMRAFFEAWKVKVPRIQIYGHRDKAKKACPCFEAKNEYSHPF